MLKRTRTSTAVVITLCAATSLLLAAQSFKRPPRTDTAFEIARGISYQRIVRAKPRSLVIHIVSVDLTEPGIRFVVTPGDSSSGREVKARTTSAFLEEFDVQVAINASYFSPFHSDGPLDYFPRAGDPVHVTGLAVADGNQYSADEPERGVLCLCGQQARIKQQDCPSGTTHAVAGAHLLVKDGEVVFRRSRDKKSPRTAIALDESRETMWLVVVDGRQDDYSEGVTRRELAHMLLGLGADIALNMDGGGSSTLVMSSESRAKVLNAPFHTRVRMRERPVANHLGIAVDLASPSGL